MRAGAILGAVLIAIGAILLIFGFNASQSTVDQLSETFTGRFTDDTMWYLIAGAAAVVAGLVMLAFGRRV